MRPDCRRIALAYIARDGQVLLTLRPATSHQGGRWEFPGGKVETGEDFPTALRREIVEEIGVTVEVGAEIADTKYQYPDICVELHLFHCALVEGEPVPRQVDGIRWASPGELLDVDFPPANAALLDQLIFLRESEDVAPWPKE
ncbi:MAG TPA: (deoxy)nucleoside triphosphate pyrophosphohydrolase [Armatimonadota bacterium]